MSHPICKVADLLFLRFELKDLEAQKTYLDHFGMQLLQETEDSIYYSGTGIAPFCYCAKKGDENKFVSAAYYVNSMQEMEALAEAFDVDILNSSEPGGGKKVTIKDPDNLDVEIFYGVEFSEPEEQEVPDLNTGFEKTRVNELQRIGKDADEWTLEDNEWRYQLKSKVMRIGHVAILCEDVVESIAWYQNTLGLLITDNLVMPNGANAGAFMRVDQGDKPVDHHVLNINGLRKGREGYGGTFGHGGFELSGSIDDLMAGHYHMSTTGNYLHEWGVGRHLLGSQIYDYWRDPAGFTLEHWIDGDLINASHPAKDVPAKHFSLGQYGPLPPSTFNLSIPNEKVEQWREEHPAVVELLKPFEKQQ